MRSAGWLRMLAVKTVERLRSDHLRVRPRTGAARRSALDAPAEDRSPDRSVCGVDRCAKSAVALVLLGVVAADEVAAKFRLAMVGMPRGRGHSCTRRWGPHAGSLFYVWATVTVVGNKMSQTPQLNSGLGGCAALAAAGL